MSSQPHTTPPLVSLAIQAILPEPCSAFATPDVWAFLARREHMAGIAPAWHHAAAAPAETLREVEVPELADPTLEAVEDLTAPPAKSSSEPVVEDLLYATRGAALLGGVCVFRSGDDDATSAADASAWAADGRTAACLPTVGFTTKGDAGDMAAGADESSTFEPVDEGAPPPLSADVATASRHDAAACATPAAARAEDAETDGAVLAAPATTLEWATEKNAIATGADVRLSTAAIAEAAATPASPRADLELREAHRRVLAALAQVQSSLDAALEQMRPIAAAGVATALTELRAELGCQGKALAATVASVQQLEARLGQLDVAVTQEAATPTPPAPAPVAKSTPTPPAPALVAAPTPAAPVAKSTPTPLAPAPVAAPTPPAPVAAPTPAAPLAESTPTPPAPAPVAAPTPPAPLAKSTPTPPAPAPVAAPTPLAEPSSLRAPVVVTALGVAWSTLLWWKTGSMPLAVGPLVVASLVAGLWLGRARS